MTQRVALKIMRRYVRKQMPYVCWTYLVDRASRALRPAWVRGRGYLP